MIYYIASEPYNEVIRSTIERCGLLILNCQVSNEFFLLKHVRQNIANMSQIEQLVIDLSALKDTDEEIIQAVENYRMMYDSCRIIILATNRRAGDGLLSHLFQLGLYNLILTDDYLTIRQELECCLVSGKTFRDAVSFKDAGTAEKVLVRQEIKQVVNKVMIAVAGSQARIGVTHTSIALASALRSKGYMVAVAEYNGSGDFQRIQESFDENLIEKDYFSIGGVDYYPARKEASLAAVLGKSYNFVIVDFGSYTGCDQLTYKIGNVRLMVAGSKAWELENLQSVFALCPEEMLKEMYFLFNLTYSGHQRDIRDSMTTEKGETLAVFFPKYEAYPYNAVQVEGMDSFLGDYFPKPEPQKKSFFKRKGQA